MSALAPSGGPALPPALLMALQQAKAGAAGAPDGSSGPADVGPSGPPSGPSTQGDGDWETDLQNAISALRELEGDAQDHQEASVIATCIAQLRKMTAQRQAGAESALGVTAAHKAMARASY